MILKLRQPSCFFLISDALNWDVVWNVSAQVKFLFCSLSLFKKPIIGLCAISTVTTKHLSRRGCSSFIVICLEKGKHSEMRLMEYLFKFGGGDARNLICLRYDGVKSVKRNIFEDLSVQMITRVMLLIWKIKIKQIFFHFISLNSLHNVLYLSKQTIRLESDSVCIDCISCLALI